MSVRKADVHRAGSDDALPPCAGRRGALRGLVALPFTAWLPSSTCAPPLDNRLDTDGGPARQRAAAAFGSRLTSAASCRAARR